MRNGEKEAESFRSAQRTYRPLRFDSVSCNQSPASRTLYELWSCLGSHFRTPTNLNLFRPISVLRSSVSPHSLTLRSPPSWRRVSVGVAACRHHALLRKMACLLAPRTVTILGSTESTFNSRGPDRTCTLT